MRFGTRAEMCDIRGGTIQHKTKRHQQNSAQKKLLMPTHIFYKCKKLDENLEVLNAR